MFSRQGLISQSNKTPTCTSLVDESRERAAEEAVARFILSMQKQEGPRKLDAILAMVRKEDFLSWTDPWGLDVLHHAIFLNNPDAVDLLLKLGYFAEPYEPQINLYAHLAARMGFKTCLYVVLKHRPGDFRKAWQPLFLPELVTPIWGTIYTNGSIVLPGVVGTVFGEPTRRELPEKPMDQSLRVDGAMLKTMGESSRGSTVNLAKVRCYSSIGEAHVSVRLKQRWCDRPRTPCLKTKRSFSVPKKGTGGTFQDMWRARRQHVRHPYTKCPVLDQTPLEVAAKASRPACVRLILDMMVRPMYPELPPCTGYFTLAVLARCDPAVKLLVKTSKRGESMPEEMRRQADLREAVECALQTAQIDCLELLLADTSIDLKAIFRPFNYFHVLFTNTASKMYSSNALSRLPGATQTLLKKGHNVNARAPARTFPLYTLISFSFCYQDPPLCQHYLQTVNVLLDGGANPDFDEVAYEQQAPGKMPDNLVVQRRAFHSAYHCLLDTVEEAAHRMETEDNRVNAAAYLTDFVRALGSHKADPMKVFTMGHLDDMHRGTALYHYVRVSVKIGVDVAVMNQFVRYGADPSKMITMPTGERTYLLNLYLDTLFKAMTEEGLEDRNYWRAMDVRSIVVFVCLFLSPPARADAAHIFYHKTIMTTDPRVRYYIGLAGQELMYWCKKTNSLKHITTWRVWKLCGRSLGRLRRLPVPASKLNELYPAIHNADKGIVDMVKAYMPIA